jgi:elongation factor P
VLDNTFSAGHKIEEVRVENHKYQYLYPEGEDFHFMNTETFEQISLNKNILDSPDLLKEGENVMVSINTETELPLSVDMPLLFWKLLMLNLELEGIQLQMQPNQQLLKPVLP